MPPIPHPSLSLTPLAAAVAVALLPWASAAQPAADAPAVSTLAPITVSAMPLDLSLEDLASPVIVLESFDLLTQVESGLGATLGRQPGIHADTYGAGASRPVIRGQTAPRVQVLADGSALMDASAISPDHAITVDPLLARRVEVLRGPAALLYGGGAIGGVVNVLDERVPTAVPEKGVEGTVHLRGATGTRERAAAFGLTAGSGNFAFRAEGMKRRAGDYRVPGWEGGRLLGSHTEASSGSLGVSWVGSRGYIGLAYSYRDETYGLPGHSHEYEDCHPHGSSLHCEGHDSGHSHDSGGHDDHDDHGGHDHGSDHDSGGHDSGHDHGGSSHDSSHGHDAGHDHSHEHGAGGGTHPAPVVRLRSERVDLRGEYRQPFAGVERVRLRAGWTNYRHDEMEPGVAGGTRFTNRGYDARVEFLHAPIGGWRGVVGLQTAYSDFSSVGTEGFIPRSRTRTAGLFLLEEYQWKDWRFNLGARHEWQSVRPEANLPSRRQTATSYSASALWAFAPQYNVSLSLSRSQRLPNAQELYANQHPDRERRGIHLATNTWEIGDPTLGKETSHNIELALRKHTGKLTFSASVYHNRVRGYIYGETLDRYEDFRLVQYTQRDARFTGAEAEVRYQFTPRFSAGVFGDVVHARFAAGGALPRIPAGRLGVRADYAAGPWKLGASWQHVYRQNRYTDYETSTPGYDLVDAYVSYQGRWGGLGYQAYLRGSNLLDKRIYNHTSYVARLAPLPGRVIMAGLKLEF